MSFAFDPFQAIIRLFMFMKVALATNKNFPFRHVKRNVYCAKLKMFFLSLEITMLLRRNFFTALKIGFKIQVYLARFN